MINYRCTFKIPKITILIHFAFYSYTGKSLSVYTPSKQITACELTSNGKFITLALKNKSKLVTLQLSNGSGDNAIEPNDDSAIYGEKENEGKVFNLND